MGISKLDVYNLLSGDKQVITSERLQVFLLAAIERAASEAPVKALSTNENTSIKHAKLELLVAKIVKETFASMGCTTINRSLLKSQLQTQPFLLRSISLNDAKLSKIIAANPRWTIFSGCFSSR